MHKLFSNLGWLVSPTRRIIDLWKVRGDKTYRGNALRRWSLLLFYSEAIGCAVLMLLFDREPSTTWSFVGVALAYYAGGNQEGRCYLFIYWGKPRGTLLSFYLLCKLEK